MKRCTSAAMRCYMAICHLAGWIRAICGKELWLSVVTTVLLAVHGSCLSLLMCTRCQYCVVCARLVCARVGEVPMAVCAQSAPRELVFCGCAQALSSTEAILLLCTLAVLWQWLWLAAAVPCISKLNCCNMCL
jgi:hypothetical protein